MNSTADRKDITRGAIALLGGFGGRLLARGMLLIGAGHLYGVTNIGVLGELAAVIEILSAIATLGLKRSLLDSLGHAAKRNHPPGEAVATALLLSTGLGGLLGGGLYLASPFIFPHDIPIPVFLAIPAAAFTDVALTATRFRRVIRWEVLARCIVEPWSLLGAALLLHALGLTNTGLPLAYALSSIMAASVAVWGLCSSFGARDVLLWRAKASALPAMFMGSLPVGLNDIGVILLRRVDLLLLGLFVDQRITGFYFMAQQITTVPHRIYRLFEPMVGPVIAGLYHDQDTESIRSRIVRMCRLVFILQLGLTMPLIIFGDIVLDLFGKQFHTAALVLAILLIAELVDGSFALAETPLVFARPFVMPALIGAALAVEVASILTFVPLWGAEGAALGFLCTTATLAAGRIFLLDRALGISVLDSRYLAPLAIAAAVGASLWAARQFLSADMPVLIGLVMLAGLALFLFLTALLLSSEEDRRVLRRLRSR